MDLDRKTREGFYLLCTELCILLNECQHEDQTGHPIFIFASKDAIWKYLI